MVREKVSVRLTPEERDRLEHLVRAGRSAARVATRARILLKTGRSGPLPRWPEPRMWLSPAYTALRFHSTQPTISHASSASPLGRLACLLMSFNLWYYQMLRHG